MRRAHEVIRDGVHESLGVLPVHLQEDLDVHPPVLEQPELLL